MDALKSTDQRYKLISHFSDPGLKLAGKGREDCESPFEEEIFDFLSEKGYMVSTQIAAAGFRIDLVVEDAAGRRLAIECDGYIAHPEHKWAEDMSRQRMLERAGWSFHRIWGPSYYSDRESSQVELLAAIQDHAIEKHHDGIATAAGIVEFRHIPAADGVDSSVPTDDEVKLGEEVFGDSVQSVPAPLEVSETSSTVESSRENLGQSSFSEVIDQGTLFESNLEQPKEDSKNKIEIGDAVTIQFDDDEDTLSFTIVKEQSSEDGKLLSHRAPIGEVLLNKAVGAGAESDFEINGRSFRVVTFKKSSKPL
jgi:very-short-patch-repair endonuclease